MSAPVEPPEVIEDLPLLKAGGDNVTYFVHRGQLSRDEDASWLQAQAHVQKHGMEFVSRIEASTDWNETVTTLLYATPVVAAQLRLRPDLLDAVMKMGVVSAAGRLGEVLDLFAEVATTAPDPNPLRPLPGEPGRFLPAVDEDQAIVLHGVLVDEDDPLWLPVREHILRRRMTVVVRAEGDHPKFNTGRAVAWWFGTAAFRARLSQNDIERFRSEAFSGSHGGRP